MTYFDQINPINDTFDQNYDNKPKYHNFKDILKKYFRPNPKVWPNIGQNYL